MIDRDDDDDDDDHMDDIPPEDNDIIADLWNILPRVPAASRAVVRKALDEILNLRQAPLDTSVARLTRDLRNAARTLSTQEARFLVDAYYAMQRDRIRADHQNRTLSIGHEPHDIMNWLGNQRETLELQVKSALTAYASGNAVGQWAMSIPGIGPVITAGLLANIDITKAPTAGHIWRYCGLDPSSVWLGRAKAEEVVNMVMQNYKERRGGALTDTALTAIATHINLPLPALMTRLTDRNTNKIDRSRANVVRAVAKRPWNGALKRLCFLIGESFVKVSNRPNDIYGQLYKERKDYEQRKNLAGDYAQTASDTLASKRFSHTTDAYKHYTAGHLPPARIHRRSARYATKIFLSHLHHVWYEINTGNKPPKPFVIDHMGHTHIMEPPNWNGHQGKKAA